MLKALAVLIVPCAILYQWHIWNQEALGLGVNEYAAESEAPQIEVGDVAAVKRRFSGLIQLKTISNASAPYRVDNEDQFDEAAQYLERQYPTVWQELSVQKVAKYSLLLRWTGAQPALKPVLFVSHMDVVPVVPETLGQWVQGPFSGAEHDGFIWGRGTLDTKGSLTAYLEGVRILLEQGYKPDRTLYLAFGHDEETGGVQGAAGMAEVLRGEGVQLEAIYDEGGVVLETGLGKLCNRPIAIVGTAEKGYHSVNVELSGLGGHSSMPPIDHNLVAYQMSRLLQYVDLNPPPVTATVVSKEFLKKISPGAPYAARPLLYLVDHWLPSLLVHNALARLDSKLAAFFRNTIAPTHVVAESLQDNVLAQKAVISFNFRLLPGSNTSMPAAYLSEVLSRLKINGTIQHRKGTFSGSGSQIAPTNEGVWDIVERAIQEQIGVGLPGLLVVPYLMPGATDSKHYAELASGKVFRFSAMQLQNSDIQRIHGINERVSVSSYLGMVRYSARLLQLAGKLPSQA